MPSISALKFFSGAILLLFCLSFFPPAVSAADVWENLGKAVLENYEESSKPLFEKEEPEVKEKLKGDPFFDKLRKKNMKFAKEEQARRRAFIEKIRNRDLSDEERQEQLAKFQKKELARRKKFIEKQQKKIQEHQEEGS